MNHSRGVARSLFNMRAERETQRAAIKHDKISPESFLVTRCCSHDLEARGRFNIYIYNITVCTVTAAVSVFRRRSRFATSSQPQGASNIYIYTGICMCEGNLRWSKANLWEEKRLFYFLYIYLIMFYSYNRFFVM